MSTFDDKKASFEQRLQKSRANHEANLDKQLADMRVRLLKDAPPALPDAAIRQITRLDHEIKQQRISGMPREMRVQIGGSTPLRQVDSFFIKEFQTNKYLYSNLMSYPTVFCETLEEFFNTFIDDLDVSPSAKRQELNRMVEEAQQTAADSHGGGIFGVNLPGQGCYLNGWLFAYESGKKPSEILQSESHLPSILMTAAHEKLGHGFLAECSVLGKTKSRLGLDMVEVARRFSLRSAEDPLTSLRQQQNGLIHTTSQLVEEGWATWVESYIGQCLWERQHPTHTVEPLIEACQNLPQNVENRQQVKEALLTAMAYLLGDQQANLQALHWAINTIEILGSDFDDYFFSAASQPLRYCIGELLLMRIETQMGPLCAPYAALTAANVAIEPDKISLSDLQTLMDQDPRLHPDTRLAAIAQLSIRNKNDVAEMGRQIEQQLSFSVPPRLLN